MLLHRISARVVAGNRSAWRASHSQAHRLNGVSEQDLAHFSTILEPSSVLSTLPPVSLPSSELDPFNQDWMGKYKGNASTVLKPKTTQQVSDIVKWCYEKRIGIVPQGGNTGLVGGSVPIADEVVLSLANMSKVRSFDPVAGPCFLKHSYVSQKKLIYIPRCLGCGCGMYSTGSDGLHNPSRSHHAARPWCKG